MNTDRAPWVVAVAASGPQGLDDIRALLANLPAALYTSVLVVLHRPWETASAPGVVYIGELAQHLTPAAPGRRRRVAALRLTVQDAVSRTFLAVLQRRHRTATAAAHADPRHRDRPPCSKR